MRVSLFIPTRLCAAALLAVSAPATAQSEPSALDRMSDTHTVGSTDGILGAARADEEAGTSTLAPDCGTPGSPPCPPGNAPQVPVDGGLSLLAAAGAAYAARTLRSRRSA